MRIGIDARMWDETGIGRYIRNIVLQLSKMDTANEYVLFLLSKDIDKVDLPANFRKVPVDIRWYSFKEQLILPIHFYRAKLDLLFVPNMNTPLLYLKKMVITIHDLTILHINTGRTSTLPYAFYFLKRLSARLILWTGIYRATKIFVVSNFVKDEIARTYKVDQRKLVVTPCAVSEAFKRYDKDSEESRRILDKYGIKNPFIFYIGNAHPHKNLEKLIEAFDLFHSQHPEIYLVLAGKKDFFYERLSREIKPYISAQKILFPGFIDDKDLPYLYSSATLFVNPSLYEGFGIQLLEAFACGALVVCSNTTSLPEVGGNIAYYFNPRSTKSIVDTLNVGLTDTNALRINHGYARSREFSWEKSAQTIYMTIKSLCE